MDWGGQGQHDRGVAMLVVLWAGVIMMLVALGISDRARTDLLLTRNLIDATEAELAADAGVWLAVSRVWTGSPEEMAADGTLHGARIGASEVRFRATDESTRIDLNAAEEAQLSQLFETIGLGEEETRALVDAIVRRREAAAYEGERTGRILHPFTSTDELAKAGGLDAAMLRRIDPLITVYTGQARPGSDQALGRGESTLEGAAGDRLDEDDAMSGRAGGGVGRAEGDAPLSRDRPTILRVEAEARSAGGAVFVREAVIVRGRASRNSAPYTLRMWRQGRAGLFDVDTVDGAAEGG